ncbi:MAG: phosphodiester glycosidase family protein [Vampirovibrio sp.]
MRFARYLLALLVVGSSHALLTVQAYGISPLGVGGVPTLQLTPTLSRLLLPLTSNNRCQGLEWSQRPTERQSVLQMNTTYSGTEALKASVQNPKRNMNAYYFELSPNGRLQLFVKHDIPDTVSMKCEESQVVVEVQERYKAPEFSQILAKGLKYVQYKVAIQAGKVFRTHHLEWDPKNSTAKLTPLMPDPTSIRGLKSVKSTLSSYNGLAGVNASFFNANLRIPLGLVLKDGELLNGTLFNRVAFGLDTQNRPSMEQVELTGLLRVDRWTQAIEVVNMPRTSSNQVALYSRLWGPKSPPAGGGNIAIRLRNGRFQQLVTEGSLAIESTNDWVLYGSATKLDAFLSLDLGSAVEVLLSTTPDWSDKVMVLAGGPSLLKKGQPYIDLEAQRFGALPPNQKRPRTMIAIFPNQTVSLIVIDALPQGATLYETAELLQFFGASEGMNLDGGTSTQMVVQGQVKFATVEGGAPVSTVLGFVPNLPWPAI